MPTRSFAALAIALACFAGGPARAASCRLTVLGAPLIDDEPCTAVGRRGDVRVAVATGDAVTVRHAVMRARILARLPDGRLRRVPVSYGRVVASDDSDEKTCYFNQKATLCLDP